MLSKIYLYKKKCSTGKYVIMLSAPNVVLLVKFRHFKLHQHKQSSAN